MTVASAKDRLVKVLAAIFLNPADRDRNGARIFIQDFLGCRCPDDVVKEARIAFFLRPLGSYLEQKIAQSGQSHSLIPLEQELNSLIGLPKTLKWPRRHSGEIIPPFLWRRPALEAMTESHAHQKRLARLRGMSKTAIDAVLEVPGRAFFFLVTRDKTKPKKTTLLWQYESGQLLYKIMRYNRCRLFTISHRDEPKIIPQIDRALTWQGLYEVFAETRHQYAFASEILTLCSDAN
jgi:hypothetical protein